MFERGVGLVVGVLGDVDSGQFDTLPIYLVLYGGRKMQWRQVCIKTAVEGR